MAEENKEELQDSGEENVEANEQPVTEVDAAAEGAADTGDASETELEVSEPADTEALLAETNEEQPGYEPEAIDYNGPADGEITTIDMLMDVSMLVTVELGRKDMTFNDILQLGKGSLVELNKIADEPVDIFVNQSKIAEGEVVVVDDHFGVRITRLLNSERLKRLG
jgi:flagellar motor switch protein FliN/FliY